MYIDKEEISKGEVNRKSLFFSIILIVVFIIIFFVCWNIQILKNNHYSTLALKNIYKDIELKAPRGLVVDRKYKILSESKIDFYLYFIREHVQILKKSLNFVCSVTGLKEDVIRDMIKKYEHYPMFYKIPISRSLELKKAIYIESHSDEYPEFAIDIAPTRAYPNGKLASHVLGYVSEIAPKELKESGYSGYKLGDTVGKSGIEKQYENSLLGEKGSQQVVRDNLGRIKEIMKKTDPIIGHTVVLTLDLDLQRFCNKILDNQFGVIGIVDLDTGGLLTLVSKPNFDPEFLSGPISHEDWIKIVNDPSKPLHNKFTQGVYSPGSVFKIIVALAALQEEILSPSRVFVCMGEELIYNHPFRCWNSDGHGMVNIYEAFRNSCNVFFYNLGKRLDVNVISKYAIIHGLGKLTGIDLPAENIGLVPTREWKKSQLKEDWYPGETISIAIGQGMLNVTPAELLVMISTVALRGKIPQLHLLKRIEKEGMPIREFEPQFKSTFIDKRDYEIIIEGLYRVVNENGTGFRAKVEGLDVCGKTGTAQVITKNNPKYKQLVKQKRFTPHSWFVSFAPRKNPRIAMVIFIENGGDAGRVAAGLAAKIYKKYFKK